MDLASPYVPQAYHLFPFYHYFQVWNVGFNIHFASWEI